MSREEPRECPFCGEGAKIEQTGKNELTISCKGMCIHHRQRVLTKSLEWLEAEMIKAWNNRISDKRIKELEAERIIITSKLLMLRPIEGDNLSEELRRLAVQIKDRRLSDE